MISKVFSLMFFMLGVVLIGMFIGYTTMPGEWYTSLNKPSFTPPNWVFAPVWTVIYIVIAITGWRCWVRDRNSNAMKLWFVQTALSFLWSPVFFGAQQPGLALVFVVAALVAVLAFIAVAWSKDRLGAVLFLPYAAWTAFATALTAGVGDDELIVAGLNRTGCRRSCRTCLPACAAGNGQPAFASIQAVKKYPQVAAVAVSAMPQIMSTTLTETDQFFRVARLVMS